MLRPEGVYYRANTGGTMAIEKMRRGTERVMGYMGNWSRAALNTVISFMEDGGLDEDETGTPVKENPLEDYQDGESTLEEKWWLGKGFGEAIENELVWVFMGDTYAGEATSRQGLYTLRMRGHRISDEALQAIIDNECPDSEAVTAADLVLFERKNRW